MDVKVRKIGAIASLVIGVVLYLLAVTGVFQGNPTPPLDIGLVATTMVFLLLGAGGLMLVRASSAA